MFNEAILNASAILQGQQILKELIGIKLQEWTNQADDKCLERLKVVLARFLKQGEVTAETGEPEKMVELVEQLRNYKPHLKYSDLIQFEVKWTGFHSRLKMITLARVGARIDEQAEKIGAPYRNKATEFRLRLSGMVLFLDENKVDTLIKEWNDLAEQWKAELEAAGV